MWKKVIFLGIILFLFIVVSSICLLFFYNFFPKDFYVWNYLISILNIFVWAGIWISIFIWYLNNIEEQKRRIFEILSKKLSEIKELKYIIDSNNLYKDLELKINSYKIITSNNKLNISILSDENIYKVVRKYEINKIAYLLADIYLQFDMFSSKLDKNMKDILKLEFRNVWNLDFFILVHIYLYWKKSWNISISNNQLDYSESEWIQKIISIIKNNDF